MLVVRHMRNRPFPEDASEEALPLWQMQVDDDRDSWMPPASMGSDPVDLDSGSLEVKLEPEVSELARERAAMLHEERLGLRLFEKRHNAKINTMVDNVFNLLHKTHDLAELEEDLFQHRLATRKSARFWGTAEAEPGAGKAASPELAAAALPDAEEKAAKEHPCLHHFSNKFGGHPSAF